MAVRDDCRHYVHRSTPTGEAMQRCRLSVNGESPFSCPDGCLFFEARSFSGVAGAGWTPAPTQPMSNTADGLLDLPPEPKRRRRKRR
jgi:hypothetical protein